MRRVQFSLLKPQQKMLPPIPNTDDHDLSPLDKLTHAWYTVQAHKHTRKFLHDPDHPSFADACERERERLIAQDEARWTKLETMSAHDQRKLVYGARDLFGVTVPKWLHDDHLFAQTKRVLKRLFAYGVDEEGREFKTLTPHRAWHAREWFDTGKRPPPVDPYPLNERDFEDPR